MATIRLRVDGRYEGIVRYQGRRISVYGRTEAEARQKLAELERRLALDQPPPPARVTVRDLYQRWLVTEGRCWKPRTAANYQQLYQRYIEPTRGQVRLSQLAPDRLQRFFDQLPGARTPHQVFWALHRCFAVAVRWDYLPANPCDRVSPPHYQPPRVELPGRDDLAMLFRFCLTSDAPGAPLVGPVLLTGLRLGEVAALCWGDIDWQQGLVRVRRSGQWIGGQWVETTPKTRAGHRDVAIGETGLAILKRQRALVNQWRLKAGQRWAGGDFVFPLQNGQPLTSSQASDSVRRLCRKAGVPTLTFHGLRHAHASLALTSGVPPDVSKRLGHSSPAITTSVYAHAIGRDERVAKMVEQALGG